MYEEFQAEIDRLTAWVESAKLPEESQVLWCLTRLPPAYRDLSRTYESRHAADITLHQQAALVHMMDKRALAPDRVAELRGRFDTLNERFGLSALPPPPRTVAARKARRGK